jgi:hypothetical protein
MISIWCKNNFLHHKNEIHDKPLFVMQQPFLDPTSSYNTLAFWTGIDGDARYPSYVTSSTTSIMEMLALQLALVSNHFKR